VKKQYQGRALILAGILFFFSMLIVFQVVRIQTSKEAELFRAWGDGFEGQVKTLYPKRGQIYDRNGHLLAGNKTVYEVGVTLAEMKNPKTIAQALKDVANMDYETTLTNLTTSFQGRIYMVLNKYVATEQAARLQQMQLEMSSQSGDASLAGLEFTPHTMRSYPEKSLGSNFMGYVTLNNHGYYGVEEKYNDLLAGEPIKTWVPLDPNRAGEMPKTPTGTDLILTIDREIQAMVESELNKGVQEAGAAAGTIVVMNPRNGEILAMASTPEMDLNDFLNAGNIYKTAGEFNRAVSMQYEPGSIFKILTMAAAIDSGLVTPQTTYLDTGFYEIGGAFVYNWDQGAWGPQDMVGCLEHSLNVCMARLADLMGEQTFYTYMARFGIGHPTGIDLASEANGRLKTPTDSDWYKVDLGTNSFGQGVAVSPIQMMAAASALANDGKMVAPHVLRAMVTNGSQKDTPPHTLDTPISAQSARTVSDMLATAMQDGKSVANVDGYRIAGKTGTAQIPGPDGFYDPKLTNASFMGWGPVDDPKFMVYVWLERPQKSDWASYVASPIFHNVVEKLVVLMDIPPDEIRQQIKGQ
jgi:cell division protein FtsI/penicillin-binding protein 2